MSIRSTFSTSFIAQKNKPKANGRVPILARIIINGEQSHFSTKLDIAPDRWLPSKNKTMGFTREEKQINATLDDFRSLIRSRYYEASLHGEVVSAAMIRLAVLGFDHRGIRLLEHFDRFNNDYRKMVGKETGHKTYTRYLLTRKLLAEFINSESGATDVALTAITPKFVNDFFVWLRNRDSNSHNYHMTFIRRFRTVYNVARSNGWVHKDPFSNFKMRFEEIERGYLTKTELTRLMKTQMPSMKMDFIRNLFVFCCYCGLSFIDLKGLKKSDIVPGDDGRLWIDTRRNKTGVRISLPLLDIPLSIIDKHALNGSDPRLFAVPVNETVNKHLRRITALCEINRKVTFHCGRHTFSTICLSKGMGIEMLSRILGHQSIQTTQIYAKITNSKIAEDMKNVAMLFENKTGNHLTNEDVKPVAKTAITLRSTERSVTGGKSRGMRGYGETARKEPAGAKGGLNGERRGVSALPLPPVYAEL